MTSWKTLTEQIKMKNILQVQSMSDVITNSSSELFIVNREDMLHYIGAYDDKYNECFKVKKMTKSFIGWNVWTDYLFDCPSDVPYCEVLGILRMTEEDAAKEGVLFRLREEEHYSWWEPVWDWDSKSKAANRKQLSAFLASWRKFLDNHKDEIEEKVIGKYWMLVEDHFDGWIEFSEEIKEKRGYLYHESRH